MSFANPMALILIPVVLAWLWLWLAQQMIARRKLQSSWVKQNHSRLISPYFWPKIIRRTLIVIGLSIIVLALARPQWGKRVEVSETNSQAVWIAIDLSNSMRVKDIAPDRLGRAKLEANDIIRQVKGASIGVVAYAGNAYLLCPLTSDLDVVNQTISDLQIGDITKQGTSLDDLIPMIVAHQSKNSGPATLVILGDGEIRKGKTENLIGDAKSAHMTVMAVAVGTESGGLIPMPTDATHTEPLKDSNGQLVISKTNTDFFKKVAQGTGGQFFESNSQQFVSQAVSQAIARQATNRKIQNKVSIRPDKFEWVLIPGVLILSLGICWGRFR